MTEESLLNLTMNTRRASRAQFEAMLNFIEERPHMVNKPTSGKSRIKCIEDWEELATLLNGMMSGVSKTAFKWSRCWIDWKCSTRKKYTNVLQNNEEDMDKPNASLNELEIRLLPFIADSVLTGKDAVLDRTNTFVIKHPPISNLKGINLPEADKVDHTYVSVIKQEIPDSSLLQNGVTSSPMLVKISHSNKKSTRETYVLPASLEDYCPQDSDAEIHDEDFLPEEKRKEKFKEKQSIKKDSRHPAIIQCEKILKTKSENEKKRLQCEIARLELAKKEMKLKEYTLRLKRGNRFRCSNVTYPLLKF